MTKFTYLLCLISMSLASLITGCGKNEPNAPYDVSKAERQAVRSQNKVLVNQCAQSSSLSRKIKIYGTSYNEYGQTDVGYFMSRLGEGFQISSRIGISIVPIGTSHQRAREMLEQTRACLPQIQEVYKRYDLFLNLDFQIYTPGVSLHDKFVTLSDTNGRSNSHKWHTRSSHFCLMVLHEISHHLTLDDEYADPRCPNRFVSTEINPASIMRNPFLGFENVDLYPRHINQILDPFCSLTNNGPPRGLNYREV